MTFYTISRLRYEEVTKYIDKQNTYTKLEKGPTLWVSEIICHYKYTSIRYLLVKSTRILEQCHVNG